MTKAKQVVTGSGRQIRQLSHLEGFRGNLTCKRTVRKNKSSVLRIATHILRTEAVAVKNKPIETRCDW